MEFKKINDTFSNKENITPEEFKEAKALLEKKDYKQSVGSTFTTLALNVLYKMKIQEVDVFCNTEKKRFMILCKGTAEVIQSTNPLVQVGELFEGASALWKEDLMPPINSVVTVKTSSYKDKIYANVVGKVKTVLDKEAKEGIKETLENKKELILDDAL